MSENCGIVGPCFADSPVWYRANTLAERVRLQRGRPGAFSADTERGRRRLERWKSQFKAISGALFEQRLAQGDLTEAELLALLSQSREQLLCAGPTPPAWVAEIERSFAQPYYAGLSSMEDELRDRPEAGFLQAIRPLIWQTLEKFREEVERLASSATSLPFDPDRVRDILFQSLPSRLLNRLVRTMALELNSARVKGLLQGATSQERFESFLARLRQPEVALDLLREYPVLSRQLVECLENWRAASLEFLRRWCADWPAVRAAFCPDYDPGPLEGIAGDVADSHRGGRSVLIVRCRSGLQVVYKPKPLAVDRHFQELLGWFNERGISPGFRQLKVIDGGAYGWEEFVSAEPCRSRDEVTRFYQRMGGYLALLYALAATDFHHENLLAAGEHPMLIDLEALFHPSDLDSTQRRNGQRVGNFLLESVLACGLLPVRTRLNGESEGVDLSGLGAEVGQQLPWKSPSWEGVGTDQMRLARRAVVLDGSKHRPKWNGTVANPLDHVDVLESGFRRVYKLLEKHRTELMAASGLLERFAHDEVRMILRPTSRYREFLEMGFHPDVLRDGLDRERLFDRLWEGVKDRPHLAHLVQAEIDDLWRSDIPLFTTRPASHDLWASAERRFTNMLSETGLERARRTLARFGTEDMARQLWLLRSSLTTLASGTHPSIRLTHYRAEVGLAIDGERLLEASRAVADRLAQTALRAASEATWIGLSFRREQSWSLLPLGTDLYDGLPGVILYLAYLGEISGQNCYTALARSALRTLRQLLLPERTQVQGIGGFTGWGGIIYMLTHLGMLWNEPTLLGQAQDLVGLLPDLIEQDQDLDIVGGSAGCTAGLLGLHACATSSQVLAVARLCGEHLLGRARPMPQGLGWDPPFPSRGPLTGFSHGAAGISWALLGLAVQTGNERFRAAAEAGIAYERSLFSAESGNWLDLRILPDNREQEPGAPACQTTWCHGAPGIGLARLQYLRNLDDPMLRTEIEAALQTTVASGFGYNHSLCHGDLGNVELLIQAADAFPPSRWRADLDRMAAAILNSGVERGWVCGNPLGVESPGLMTGLAGIGYGLLRLAQPKRVPSILTLGPPPASHKKL